jgi:hypothetical protein
MHRFNTNLNNNTLRNYEQYYDPTKGGYINYRTAELLSPSDRNRIQALRESKGLPLLPEVPERLRAGQELNKLWGDGSGGKQSGDGKKFKAYFDGENANWNVNNKWNAFKGSTGDIKYANATESTTDYKQRALNHYNMSQSQESVRVGQTRNVIQARVNKFLAKAQQNK